LRRQKSILRCSILPLAIQTSSWQLIMLFVGLALFRISDSGLRGQFIPTQRDIRMRLFQVRDARSVLIGQGRIYPGKVFTHDVLLKRVWGNEHSRDAEYLRVYIGRLRRKIENDSSKPSHILTEPGIGYYFVK
jgi:hypothetical protein